MREQKVKREDGEEIIQVRSDDGKLLYVKTRSGYEMKCPRSKQICLIKYEDMIEDCLFNWLKNGRPDTCPLEDKDLLELLKKAQAK
jgi:hypothetical protein